MRQFLYPLVVFMQKTFIVFLNYISGQLDKEAHIGRHRFVKEKDVGIAYGEQTLRRLISFLSVDMVFDFGANIGQDGQQLREENRLPGTDAQL